jgi:hypothetical protein
MSKTATQETHWKRLGAAVRLREIQAETDAIYAAFPELRHGKSVAAVEVSAPAGSVGPRGGRRLSPEARKRMSAGMRRFWARRKAAAAKAGKAARVKA